MQRLHQVPFLRLCLPFIAGILCGIEADLYVPHLWIVLVAASFILVLIFVIFKKKKVWKATIVGVFITIWLCVAGFYVVQLNNPFYATHHITKNTASYTHYIGKIVSEPLHKPTSVKCEIELLKIKTPEGWKPVCGKVVAYFKKDTATQKLLYGDVLVIKGTPESISPPLNPHEFNLKRYYGFHHISHRQYIATSAFNFTGKNEGNILFSAAYTLRKMALTHFEKYIPAQRECQIASALVLGIKTDVDDSLKAAYSAAGAMHVLAVSGLHVGLIYAILQWLTSFILSLKRGVEIQSVFLIAVLWVYALVTGLSPSVLRAVTMLSFILVSKILHRKNQTFNSLFATVFLLLAVNPYMLMEVGFQLSFLAVFGILYLYPKIYALLHFENTLADSVWGITVMSIVAQLATAPVSLLYFHQFPTYFIFSNWVVIPAATLIMYSGLVFVAIGWLPYVGATLGSGLYYAVYYLNETMLWVEKLPFSTVSGISISILNTWLIYGLMVFLIIGFVHKQFSYFKIATLLSAFIGINMLLFNYNLYKQKEWIVYHINGGYAMEKIEGATSYFYADSATIGNRSKMQFHILNHRWAKGVKQVKSLTNIHSYSWGVIGAVDNKTFIHFTQKSGVPSALLDIPFDFALFSFDSYVLLYRHTCHAKKVIVDGSIPKYSLKKLAEKHPNIHFTSQKGAYVL